MSEIAREGERWEREGERYRERVVEKGEVAGLGERGGLREKGGEGRRGRERVWERVECERFRER